jgi:DNA-binding response OmpR family regulator
LPRFFSLSIQPISPSNVLVVDDDEQVRGFVRKVLQQDGYVVWTAADPEEALSFAREHRGPINLLLADIALPWMRGTELFERFSPHHPETRVIYMSGYTPDAIGSCEVLAAGGGFLQKPFDARVLMERVREALEP